MNNITSPVVALTHGVPQGSILGPLLFNFYINDLPKAVNSNMMLYADDSVIYESASTFDQACQMVKEHLARVNDILDASKTKSMYFSPRPPDSTENIRIEVSGNVIEYVNVYKYLGIQLDSKLSFNNQFNDTYNLASY